MTTAAAPAPVKGPRKLTKSWVKIFFAVLGGLLVAGLIALVAGRQ